MKPFKTILIEKLLTLINSKTKKQTAFLEGLNIAQLTFLVSQYQLKT